MNSTLYKVHVAFNLPPLTYSDLRWTLEVGHWPLPSRSQFSPVGRFNGALRAKTKTWGLVDLDIINTQAGVWSRGNYQAPRRITTYIFPEGLSVDTNVHFLIKYVPRNMKRSKVPSEFKMSCTPIQSHTSFKGLCCLSLLRVRSCISASVVGIVSHVSAAKSASASDGDRTRAAPWNWYLS